MAARRNRQSSVPPNWAGVLLRARFAILWERAWPHLAFILCVAGLALSLVWFGIWHHAPFVIRATAAAIVASLFAWAAFHLLRIDFPDRRELLDRLDRTNGKPHRAVLSIADKAAGGPGESTKALWTAHRNRLLVEIGQPKAGLPSPRLVDIDHYALRALVLIITVTAFFFAGDQRVPRLQTALAPTTEASDTQLRLDAWISPPTYTGRVPLLLPSDSTEVAEAPEGSEFVLRTGDTNIQVSFLANDSASAQNIAAFDDEKSEYRFILERSGTMMVHRNGSQIRRWAIHSIDDLPPFIELAQPPAATRSGALALHYSYSDDYGVVSARTDMQAAEDDARDREHLIGPPEVTLTLPAGTVREGSAITNRDLRNHPWAGIRVELGLIATDAAEQTGHSQPVEFVLPQRGFSHPLARAIIEQRRNLALDREAPPQVMKALDALSIAPHIHMPDASVYLLVRTARHRIENARTDDDMIDAVEYLLHVARAIEDGVLSLAAQNLRDIQERLSEALENNASDQEIQQLMDELRQAMAEFMNEMMRQAGNLEDLPELTPEQMDQALSAQSLEQMMDQIEDLARNGARDAARDLLSQLQDMMNNMRMGQAPQQGQMQQDMARTLEELGDLMQQQQELMDQTFQFNRNGPNGQQEQGQLDQRGSQRGQRQGNERGSEQGQAGSEHSQSLEDLQARQKALQEALDQLLARMRERGQNPQGSMNDAGDSMGDAESAIGEGELGSAVGKQADALEALQQGAQQMADQMASQMAQSNQSGMGRTPTDPLGRQEGQRPRNGQDLGLGVKIPDQFDVERARKLLEELRNRLSDPRRRTFERNYLERLLEGF